jgi:Gram-negative bacterial TonB protein C-terminal
MFAQMIALLAAAAPAAQASPDATPAAAEVVVAWPSGGTHSGVDGHVTLQCLVDTHGLAETCRVASESPAGKDLGRAALGLRTTFKLKPASGPDGQPGNAMMAINVRFHAVAHEFDSQELARQLSTPGAKGYGTLNIPSNDSPIPATDDARIDYPVWAKAATFEELAAAYPAKGAGVEGYAAAHCRLERDGDKAGLLRDCRIVKEAPDDAGFGRAALGLTPRFRVEPATLANLPRSAPIFVDVAIRLPPPSAADARAITAPQWVTGLDPKTVQKLFPPEAAAQGLKTGRGIARCTVGADGQLNGCTPEPGEPSGLGFSEAAVRLVSGMKMNLWSADGAPVQGGVIQIPIRLNLNAAN